MLSKEPTSRDTDIDSHDITNLLHDWRAGDADALEALTPLVYEKLRVLAARAFRGESAGHTLQPTALVNEALQGLIGSDVEWQDRKHFYALAARMMRRILINHATAKKAARRGGGAVRVTIQDAHASTDSDTDTDVLALDEALCALATFDERKANVVELHYFAGLTYREMADLMNIAESTVHQDLRIAKAWLHQRMAV